MFGERPVPYRTTLGVLAVVVAIAGATAVWVQIAGLVRQDSFVWSEYFSYFTILTVVANCVVLLFSGFHSFQFERDEILLTTVRHVLVGYAVITSGVYHLLLRDATDATDPYVSADSLPMQIFHTWLPVYLVIDWLINPYRAKSRWSSMWLALVFPFIWLVFTMVRGSQTGWYPYPFLDPSPAGGYERIALTAAVITVAFLVVHLALTVINRLHHRPTKSTGRRIARR
jgi:hypothetical protein